MIVELGYPLTMIGSHSLANGDCFDVMHNMKDGSVDLILADLPYGTTANKWDSILDLDRLWSEYLRIAKQTAAIVLTASQPFTSTLVMSRRDLFKHEWIWIKNSGSNFANTVREPFKEHESVLVFSRGGWTYNKQMQQRTGAGKEAVGRTIKRTAGASNYRTFSERESVISELRVPSSWQKFNVQKGFHPTQKPVDLMRYLIRTYSNLGEVVFDNTMGSGTTGVAAVQEGRIFKGIEKDVGYFDIAVKRVTEAVAGVSK